jgi:pyrroloquinoline quinone (PQQ) biosynthesis protein C
MTPLSTFASAAGDLSGAAFEQFHRALARFNSMRLDPRLPTNSLEMEMNEEAEASLLESRYIEAVRRELAPMLNDVPQDPGTFIEWYENLEKCGPGQHDPLFAWLEREATSEEMHWFLLQEVAGEAGFEDLLAMTQVKMSTRAKLEMARNYWDEMGRGREKGMHGGLLSRLADHLDLQPRVEVVVPEALALGNAMIALARHRRYAFHSVGALGSIEMTAPARADSVNKGLKRLRVPSKQRLYFAVHAVLDVKHSEEWNREVLRPLVEEDGRRAHAIAEGALIRLWHGQRCFERYRRELRCGARSEAA